MPSRIPQIRAALFYDPETGFITSKRTGKRLGSLNGQGYQQVWVRVGGVKRLYHAHRLAFVLMLGRWPDKEADHVNMDKSDNRWSNLREVTRSRNGANKSLQKNNTSGFRGVFPVAKSQTWRAEISVDRKRFHLGCFQTKEEAAAAHCAAGFRFFGDNFRAEYLIEY